mmetsp:Transcript_25290/g.55449  ORF Transcript_25290/g.55449 Transcript_25290/m.55449 type:complete len:332 (-) Transcript_25290:41-1036(-)
MSSSSKELPKIYSLEEIEQVVSTPDFRNKLIDGIKEGFVALAKGEFFAAPIQTLGLPPFPFLEVDDYAAQTCVKSGYFKGHDHYVIKVASGGHPMPNSGLMQVYSQKTGKLEALLLDEGILTELRTAAVGALAAKLLAPKIEMIGVIGSGIQARYQLEMLSAVTSCRNVLVWGRTPSNVDSFISEMTIKGWKLSAVASPDQMLEDTDLIITTTPSREAILGKSSLATRKSGLTIICIGADAPGKHELNPALIAKANLLVADTSAQSIARGEFQSVVADCLITKESLVPLGQLIQNEDLHRKQGDDRFIVFDSSGVALQDCVVSSLVVGSLD